MDDRDDPGGEDDGLKPLTVISEDGRILYDSKLAHLVRNGAGDRMRGWLVRSRLDALRRGEGLTQRDLARKVDEAFGLKPLRNGNPRSYRSINEYFSGAPIRDGAAAAYLGAMEKILLGEIAEYFGDTDGAKESLLGDSRHVEVFGEFLHRVDEIVAGYMMAGSGDGELARYYGGPLTDDYGSVGEVGSSMADRTTRSLVGVYVHKASSSAWQQGLRDQFLLHQACFGLFRALVRRVAALPGPRDRTCAEEAADRIILWVRGLRRAFGQPGRGVDPIDGPRSGIRIDPFLAYPTWRRFAYANRLKQSTYTAILNSKVDKAGPEEDGDLASAHTIQAVRNASDTVSRRTYQTIAKYAFETDDWQRIPLSDDDRQQVATEYLEHHLPGLESLRCDGEAIRRMFGEGCEDGIGPNQIEHRRKYIEDDPAGFRDAERAVQRAWEEAIDLAEAKLRRLGVSGDGAVMVFLSSAIAVEIHGFLEDPRFRITALDGKTYEPGVASVSERAFEMLRYFVNYVDGEYTFEDGSVSC